MIFDPTGFEALAEHHSIFLDAKSRLGGETGALQDRQIMADHFSFACDAVANLPFDFSTGELNEDGFIDLARIYNLTNFAFAVMQFTGCYNDYKGCIERAARDKEAEEDADPYAFLVSGDGQDYVDPAELHPAREPDWPSFTMPDDFDEGGLADVSGYRNTGASALDIGIDATRSRVLTITGFKFNMYDDQLKVSWTDAETGEEVSLRGLRLAVFSVLASEIKPQDMYDVLNALGLGHTDANKNAVRDDITYLKDVLNLEIHHIKKGAREIPHYQVTRENREIVTQLMGANGNRRVINDYIAKLKKST